MTDTSDKRRPDYTGVFIGAILAPVYLIFVSLGKEELGRSIFILLGMVIFAIKLRWRLRRKLWFWVVVVLVLAAQAPLLFIVRWPRGFHGWLPAVASLPIGLAELLIILGAVELVERYVAKAPPAEGA